MPARAPASMLILHIVIRPSIDSASMALPRYSMTWPCPPPVPIFAMTARMMSFALTPAGSSAVDVDRHRLERTQRQRLRGEHMLNLRRPDAHRDRTERAVGGCVTVAADDRHAGLRQTELRPDDVHDALLDVAHRVQPDAELFAVASQRFDLSARYRIGDRLVDVDRRHVVILGGDRQIRSPDAAARKPQPVERLRAGHLVHEVQVDVDQVGFAGFAGATADGDDVVVPYLLRHGAGPGFGCHT